jgi:release factor glutamine methyltransferase
MADTVVNLLIEIKQKRLSDLKGIRIVTDREDYLEEDQVFPIHAEQEFFLDELNLERIKNASVLEIGVGSGILSIGALKQGARVVTALEINPRAKIFAGFNAIVNNVENRLTILDGDIDNIFRPVDGQKYDYIISNPPFEPTPINGTNFYHSKAGLLGLDFVESIFKSVDNFLKEDGFLQMVTAAPGNKNTPFPLIELAKTYLKGTVRIVVNPIPITFAHMSRSFAVGSLCTDEQLDEMVAYAAKNEISHEHLCVIHYSRTGDLFEVTTSQKEYLNWEYPLSEVQMFN